LELEATKALEGTDLRIVKGMERTNSWFTDQLISGKHVALIKALLEDELEPATAAFFDRIPGETEGITPHFDAIGHGSSGATIWIALDKADTENGCLYYVRGTHKNEYEHSLNLPFDVNSEGAFPVEINPGDLAIHNSRTVHWSLANESGRSRRAVSYFYWAASSKPGVRRAKAFAT
tara:strand:+ start:2756 stop:3286 length:531 start_codon:yes stop_codon:yes gene_type:complete